MTEQNRREFLGGLTKLASAGAASGLLPASIQRALALPANRRTGTLLDVEHIVILTQENRSFDHYFGTLAGVRGFADPFPIPVPDSAGIVGKTVWHQPNASPTTRQPAIAPFRLNTEQRFEYLRVEGTPHAWSDAQHAWNEGRLNRWTIAKRNHSLGYFTKDDIPFQWALADAFTICDAYHCSLHAGTNPNRLFVFTGTNDPLAKGNGPATYNDYDFFYADPGGHGGYVWTTYAERLEQAGISWQVYEDMEDNFTDNPLAGFKTFRDAWFERPGHQPSLRARGVSTRALEALAEDVLADRLPQVSWIVATAEGSEHPGPSSPAQGAAYIDRVLTALTANPDVWSKTVLLINFDENDGFFDHVPPPAPPSYLRWDADPTRAVLAGASTVDTTGEYHEHLVPYHDGAEERALLHRPYGLGPRVPLYVISPWSKGGWVNSQVFDHTSVIRFIEARFGVHEPNISAWRRAVCGDLTSAFDFAHPDRAPVVLPDTAERARAAGNLGHSTPPIPSDLVLPAQEAGLRRSRALPYELHVNARIRPDAKVALRFANTGRAAAVLHVYNRLDLAAVPRRYTVEPGKSLAGVWRPDEAGAYDLWVIGPNGFHRHFTGTAKADTAGPEVRAAYAAKERALRIWLTNDGDEPVVFRLAANKYDEAARASEEVPAHSIRARAWTLCNGPWYDLSVTAAGFPTFSRRLAGRMETGEDSFSDPALEGIAIVDAFA
jgi:phospholipase C